jgi:hypothetical protein
MTISPAVRTVGVGTTPPVVVSDLTVARGRRRWRRVLLRTPWLTASDDLGAVLLEALAEVPDGEARPGDVVALAEKVAVVTSGRVVEPRRPGALAKVLARAVRPVGNSCGLSLPAKMQYVIDDAGRARVVGAALAAAVSRPLGLRGVFYQLAGATARDLDGLRGAYSEELLPPLRPAEAALLAHHLTSRVGRAVAIVDVNDRGGTVRSAPAGGPDPTELLALLADNPHGDCAQSTPVVLLRPLPPVVPRPRRSGE